MFTKLVLVNGKNHVQTRWQALKTYHKENPFNINNYIFINFIYAQEYKIYHQNGKLSSIGKNNYGKKTGEWKEYDKSGELIKNETYNNGEKHI